MESILTSIKKLMGIEESYTHFDRDLIVHINTVFSILHQMGIGPKEQVTITNKNDKWNRFGDAYDMLKTYVYLKVKLMFDVPANSVIVEAINKNISEIEWRLYSEFNYNKPSQE